MIKLAEEDGLIGRLSNSILEEAIITARKWLSKRYNFGRMTVNVSAMELANPHYLENVLTLCKKHGVPHSFIENEITESVRLDCVNNSVCT